MLPNPKPAVALVTLAAPNKPPARMMFVALASTDSPEVCETPDVPLRKLELLLAAAEDDAFVG